VSKGNGWVPLDKELKKSLPKDGRSYTPLEAMFSFSCDIDDGNKWTIKGYSKLWGWSRCKVRSFVNSIRHPTGHTLDTLKTHLRHTVHFIDKGLWDIKDTLKTPFRHPLDTPLDPTIYPNPNPKEKEKNNAPFQALKFLTDHGIKKEIAKDWLKVRKTRRLTNTERAFNTIFKEIEKTGRDINSIIEICIVKSWGGFQSEWLDNIKIENEPDTKKYCTPAEAEHLKKLNLWKPHYAIKETTG
jgi:hypothetical protein